MGIYVNGGEYIAAFVGGLIIGLSTTLNLLLFGKITGLSGILGGITFPTSKKDIGWRYDFIVGLITIPYIIYLSDDRETYFYEDYTMKFFDSNRHVGENEHIGGFIIGGILVGFGTKVGNGCTSGHGVCGLPRFSKRSIVAVCVFMFFGFGTATIRWHADILKNGKY